MSVTDSFEETRIITDAVFEGYAGDFESGMKINAKTRDKIMEIHKLSWDEPLESLTKLLPEAKRRAENMVLTIECNHIDINYFSLCEILWDKYKKTRHLDVNSGTSYFIPSVTKMNKWPISKYQKYLIYHIEKLIKTDVANNSRKFDRLMKDLSWIDYRINSIGLDILMGKL